VADLCKAGKHGAAMGVFGTIWDIGEASGPILAGLIIFTLGNLNEASAYLGAFTIIAGVLAVAGVTFAATIKVPELAAERASS
jgi:MFS family permease